MEYLAIAIKVFLWHSWSSFCRLYVSTASIWLPHFHSSLLKSDNDNFHLSNTGIIESIQWSHLQPSAILLPVPGQRN